MPRSINLGSKILSSNQHYYEVYGTLENPVHAVNLEKVLSGINDKFNNPFIIAIDACLGQLKNVGCTRIELWPLKPGTGVNKSLPEVGNVHIKGIVNVGEFMEYLVLQSTRLNLVMKIADFD